MTKIKICGLTRAADISYINTYHPDYVGFVFAKSRRQITTQKAIELKAKLASTITVVGVFVDENPAHILSLLNHGVIDVAQLHGHESESAIAQIKMATKKPIIKAVSVKSLADILAWKNSAADYLLLDHGNGGSGKAFDWQILAQLKDTDFDKPYFLAGGLTAQNVTEALFYAPYGVDTSGGVELDGVKNEDLIRAFIGAVRNKEEK